MGSLVSPDGVRLSFELEGSGPVLVLHLGAGCDSGLWRATGYVTPLSNSYRCVLFDHRGQGQSDAPPGPEANHIDRYVDDVVALLDHLGVERAAFWGYSNAIAVGLRVAQTHPERLAAMVGSGALAKPPASQAELVARVQQSIGNSQGARLGADDQGLRR